MIHILLAILAFYFNKNVISYEISTQRPEGVMHLFGLNLQLQLYHIEVPNLEV